MQRELDSNRLGCHFFGHFSMEKKEKARQAIINYLYLAMTRRHVTSSCYGDGDVNNACSMCVWEDNKLSLMATPVLSPAQEGRGMRRSRARRRKSLTAIGPQRPRPQRARCTRGRSSPRRASSWPRFPSFFTSAVIVPGWPGLVWSGAH